MSKEYRGGAKEASTQVTPIRALVTDELDRLVREGARQMIGAMLDAEVDDYLQRTRYERGALGAAIATATRPHARSGWASARFRSVNRG